MIISAARPSLKVGPRSATSIMTIALRHHRIDPQALPIYRLIIMLERWMPTHYYLLEHFMTERIVPCGPFSMLAAGLTQLNARLERGYVVAPSSERTSLIPGTRARKEWLHSWRSLLRTLIIAKHNQHRRDFGGIPEHPVDWEGSLSLLRSTKGAYERLPLEALHAGALLTPERRYRQLGVPFTHCQYCAVADTELHRFWHCPRWDATRPKWIHLDQEPIETLALGLFRLGHEHTIAQIRELQAHLCKVTSETFDEAEQNIASKMHDPVAAAADDHDPSAPQAPAPSRPHDDRTPMRQTRMTTRTCQQKRRRSECPWMNSAPAGKKQKPSEPRVQLTHDLPPQESEPPSSVSGGGVEEYDGPKGRRIRCLRCLANAAISSAKKFTGAHKNCGAKRVRGEYKNSAPLPPHICIEERQLLSSPDTNRRVLVCRGCSGVGGMSNRSRFVAVHLQCLDGSKRSGRTLPTRADIHHCEAKIGLCLKDLSKVSRERAMKALLK